MRSRRILLAVSVVAMSLVMALPAAANKVSPHAGPEGTSVKAVGLVINGLMWATKAGTCDDQGIGTTLYGSAGLGLPWPLGMAKHGWWTIEADTVNLDSSGSLRACGRLGPVGDVVMPSGRSGTAATKPGIGACGMARGHSGFGRIEMDDDPDKAVYLRNLEWTWAGVTMIVTGDAVQVPNGQNHMTKTSQDKFLAVLQNDAVRYCFNKRDNFDPPLGTGQKRENEAPTLGFLQGAYTIQND